MVEGLFSKMTKQMLRGIRVKSKEELAERIYLYFNEVNEEPVVFHWKYNLDDMMYQRKLSPIHYHLKSRVN